MTEQEIAKLVKENAELREQLALALSENKNVAYLVRLYHADGRISTSGRSSGRKMVLHTDSRGLKRGYYTKVEYWLADFSTGSVAIVNTLFPPGSKEDLQ